MLCPGEHVTWPLLCPLTCRVGFLLHSYTCTSSSPEGHSRVSGSYVPCILSSFRDSLENNSPGRPQVQRPGIALGFSNTRGVLSLLNIHQPPPQRTRPQWTKYGTDLHTQKNLLPPLSALGTHPPEVSPEGYGPRKSEGEKEPKSITLTNFKINP